MSSVSAIKRKRKSEEIEAQSTVLEGLRYLGFQAWRNQKGVIPVWGGEGEARRIVTVRKNKEGQYTNGLPDIFFLVHPHGRLVGIEMKSSTGVQKPEQTAWQRRFEAAGAQYWVARSWEDVAVALKQNGYTKGLVSFTSLTTI